MARKKLFPDQYYIWFADSEAGRPRKVIVDKIDYAKWLKSGDSFTCYDEEGNVLCADTHFGILDDAWEGVLELRRQNVHRQLVKITDIEESLNYARKVMGGMADKFMQSFEEYQRWKN